MFRDILRIFATNLAVNLSTFLVVSISPYFLSTESFSKFVLVIAAATFSYMLIDFGLNISTVKKYAEAKEPHYLSILMTSKLVIFVLALPAIPLMFLGGNIQFWAVVILSAASLNWWSGLRAFEQAQQNYDAYAKANLHFAVARLVFGLSSLALGNWMITSLALFVGPTLVMLFVERKLIISEFKWIERKYIASLFKYSAFLHLDSIFYGASMYVPQAFISTRLDAVEVGTFGLIMTFIAPLAMINTSLRAYLLPRICSGEIKGSILLANKKVIFGVAAGLCIAILGIILSSHILDFLYGKRYPELADKFVIYFSFSIISMLAAMFAIEVHRLGMIRLYATVHGIGFAILSVLLYQFGKSFESIIWISASMILTGEIVQAAIVRYYVNRTVNQSVSMLNNTSIPDKLGKT